LGAPRPAQRIIDTDGSGEAGAQTLDRFNITNDASFTPILNDAVLSLRVYQVGPVYKVLNHEVQRRNVSLKHCLAESTSHRAKISVFMATNFFLEVRLDGF